jgi:hypothetical protein
MNVVVDGTPESCLAQLQGYFARDWPHGGRFATHPPNMIKVFARKRYLWDSPGGILLALGLAIVTAGAFIPLYGIYWMLMDSSSKSEYHAQVIATPESPTQTRLSISASREDWARTLESWAQQELVENKAAKGPLYEPSDSAVGTGDIPRQIERLAELRDAGVITTEDFDEKKRDLLDRM